MLDLLNLLNDLFHNKIVSVSMDNLSGIGSSDGSPMHSVLNLSHPVTGFQ